MVIYSCYEVGIIIPFYTGKNGEGEGKIQREEVICLKPHRYQVAELGLQSGFSSSWH